MNKQMIKIMKKMNKEFVSFADQYSDLREDTIKKVNIQKKLVQENKIKRLTNLATRQEEIIINLRFYLLKLIKRHGINRKRNHFVWDLEQNIEDSNGHIGKYLTILTRNIFSYVLKV